MPGTPIIVSPASEAEELEHESVQQQPSRIGKKVVTVYLSESLWREAKILAARTDNTIGCPQA